MSAGTIQPPQRAKLAWQQDDFWHPALDAKLRGALHLGGDGSWELWKRELARQSRPRLARLLPGGAKSLLWSLAPSMLGDPARDLLQRMTPWLQARKAARSDDSAAIIEELRRWIGQQHPGEYCAQRGLEMLGWCYALPKLASVLCPTRWWKLFDLLLAAAQESPHAACADGGLACQLLHGELPIALCALFPEIAPCRALGDDAQVHLQTVLAHALDGQGLPKSGKLDELGPLVASWTRSAAMADAAHLQSWEPYARERFVLAVQNVIRLMRADGSQALSTGEQPPGSRKLLKAARMIAADRHLDQVARLAASGRKKSDRKRDRAMLPDASANSEAARTSVLRSGWHRSSPRLVVNYADRLFRCELVAGKDVLWSGGCNPFVYHNQTLLESIDDWDELCWISDNDVDYLEVEMTLTNHFRVQRQILLTKNESFLYMADAVLAAQVARIDYSCTLPLAAGTTFAPADESREGFLMARDRPRALVLPLAQSEWRADRRPGELAASAEGLAVRQWTVGQHLYAPLFVWLDAKRRSEPFTWRHLSVAENRGLQPDDAAVGYRVQVGKRQWVIYRSLTPPAVRTLLGQNIGGEFYVGRFRRSGASDMLIEIEP